RPGRLNGLASAFLRFFSTWDNSKTPLVNTATGRLPKVNGAPPQPLVPAPSISAYRLDPRGEIAWRDAPVLRVAFNHDGQGLMVGSDAGPFLQLYDLGLPGTPVIRPFNGHTSWVNQVALSADGQRALSGGNDGTMRLWDVETGKEIRRPFTGFPSAVERVSL